MTEGKGECKALSLLFRIAALGLSVAAVVVMGTASQVVLVDGTPGSSSYSTVSYSQYNALRYFVAASVISAICSAAALYLYAVRADAVVFSVPMVPLFDAAAQGFLFSAAGAAFAAHDVLEGSRVCHAAAAFCGRATVAAAACAVAAVSAAAAALTRDVGISRSGGRTSDW